MDTSHIRPLRGSHLIFPAWRLPVAQALSFLHPVDRRPVFIFPWEGITLVGTTDVDHDAALNDEPAISPEEVAYLMAAVESQFPSLNLTLDDVTATFAGVRPVIGTGKEDPSKESRDHVVWEEDGLLTVTGGKLTTFRRIALDVLKSVSHRLPGLPKFSDKLPVLDPTPVSLPAAAAGLDESQRRRLLGRYGAAAADLVAAAQPGELEPIPDTAALWAELRWAARSEAVLRLDDLLLRRVRLGLLLPGGGEALLPRIRAICQPELGWDDATWDAEQAAYLALWRGCYSLPDRSAIPDWKALLTESRLQRQVGRRTRGVRRRRWLRRSAVAGSVGGAVVAARRVVLAPAAATTQREAGMKLLPRAAYLAQHLLWQMTRPLILGVRLLLVQDGAVLLVKHTYQPYWYLPGGAVKRGEMPEAAARREMAEEVGGAPTGRGALRLLGVFSNFYEGKSDHVIVFGCDEFTWTKADRWEIEQVALFQLDQLPANLSPGSRRRIEEYLAGQHEARAAAW